MHRISLLFRALSIAALAVAIAGCSTTPQTRALLARDDPGIPARVELTAVPFHPQEEYQCGPASLATVLAFSAVEVSPDALVSQVYVPGRQGAFQVEMLAATRQYQRLAHTINPTLEALFTSVANHQPVLVLQNLGLDWYPQWHYAVVVGYDLDRRRVVLRSGVTERYEMGMRLFERTWRRAEHWGMVVLAPGELPVGDNPRGYFLSVAAFEAQGAPDLVDLAWRSGLERWPDSLELLMGHGNHLYGQGRYPDAAERFRAVTELNPTYGPGYNNLARVLLKSGQRDEALAAATRAVDLGGDLEALYRDTLEQIRQAPDNP